MKYLLIVLVMFCSLNTMGTSTDPMGLSDYIIKELHSDNKWYERRLTNHEVDLFKVTGVILPDGSINQYKDNPESWSQGGANVIRSPKPSAKPVPVVTTKPFLPKKHHKKNAVKDFHPKTHKVVARKKPTHKEVGRRTKTKHVGHSASKGTIQVRPTNFPDNPTRDEIHQMQKQIQSIERRVGKALDLSLSAYAVAEIPQATHGRSSIGAGTARSSEGGAIAAGYSKNFGSQYEYTVKINFTHAGQTDSVGAGLGWEF